MKSRKILSLLFVCAMMCSVTACNNADNTAVAEEQQAQQAADELATKEIHMNDYLGGTRRTIALKENILTLVDTMKSNNATIRESSPDTFWSKDGYQDFVTNFMNSTIIDDTMWFNEEEASWEDTYQATPHNKQSVQIVKKNTRQKRRVSREILSFLRKGIQNQTDGENLSARYRFANANMIFCLAVCFFKPRYRVLR